MSKFILISSSNGEKVVVNSSFIKMIVPTVNGTIIHFEHGFQPVMEPSFSELQTILGINSFEES